MSYHLIPIDQLMQLDIPTLSYALFLFQREIDGTITCLKDNPEARTDEKLLDDLQHLLTLRKVFLFRIEELKGEAPVEIQKELAGKAGMALVATLA